MTISAFRSLGLLAVAVASLQLTGCAMPMAAPQATIQNTAKLRTAPLAPARLGSFTLAAGQPADMDKGVSLRGSQVQSTYNGSLAQYLKETLRVELDAAGLLDPASQTVISGTLTESDADAAIGTGTAKLGARFVVTQGQAVKYDRTLHAPMRAGNPRSWARWPSRWRQASTRACTESSPANCSTTQPSARRLPSRPSKLLQAGYSGPVIPNRPALPACLLSMSRPETDFSPRVMAGVPLSLQSHNIPICEAIYTP